MQLPGHSLVLIQTIQKHVTCNCLTLVLKMPQLYRIGMQAEYPENPENFRIKFLHKKIFVHMPNLWFHSNPLLIRQEKASEECYFHMLLTACPCPHINKTSPTSMPVIQWLQARWASRVSCLLNFLLLPVIAVFISLNWLAAHKNEITIMWQCSHALEHVTIMKSKVMGYFSRW